MFNFPIGHYAFYEKTCGNYLDFTKYVYKNNSSPKSTKKTEPLTLILAI